MPKDSKLYSVLYPVFMLAVFLVPLLLMVGQYLYLSKSGKVDVFAGVSSVGSSIIILMTFINFITAIEKHYRPELVITAFTFVFAELLLGYLVISLKELYFAALSHSLPKIIPELLPLASSEYLDTKKFVTECRYNIVWLSKTFGKAYTASALIFVGSISPDLNKNCR
jgi:hypothetical protein